MDQRLPNQTQLAERAYWRRLMMLVVIFGLLLTTMVAEMQQRGAERERALLLSAEADRVTGLLVDSIGTTLGNFESAINFVVATHPGPLDQYQRFMLAESAPSTDGDPGVMVFESVAIGDVAGLNEREAALGNDDFRVMLFPGDAEERFILTRLVEDPGFSGLSLLGIDATSVRDRVIPQDTEDGGFELFVADSAEALGLLPTQPVGPEDLSDHVAFLISKLPQEADGPLGYAVAGIGVAQMIGAEQLNATTELHLALFVDGVDDTVFTSERPDAPSGPDDALSLTRSFQTAGLTWTFDLWASPGFGPSTGLFSPTRIWLGGLSIIIAALILARRRQAVQRRLNSARSELENAITEASTDALTGLLNRKGLVDAARGCDPDGAAALFFLDLDGFKAVNDVKGHERGDEVLRRVASELRAIFRSKDLVSRLGGDEFVVFVQGSPYENFTNAASGRIIDAVSKIDARVTCSVGVSTRPVGSSTDIKDMLRQADSAMYRAKRSGGDRFAIDV